MAAPVWSTAGGDIATTGVDGEASTLNNRTLPIFKALNPGISGGTGIESAMITAATLSEKKITGEGIRLAGAATNQTAFNPTKFSNRISIEAYNVYVGSDSSIDVAGLNFLAINNSAAYTVANLTNGVPGQVLYIKKYNYTESTEVFLLTNGTGDGRIHLNDAATTIGGTVVDNTVKKFIYSVGVGESTGVWYSVGHLYNTAQGGVT